MTRDIRLSNSSWGPCTIIVRFSKFAQFFVSFGSCDFFSCKFMCDEYSCFHWGMRFLPPQKNDDWINGLYPFRRVASKAHITDQRSLAQQEMWNQTSYPKMNNAAHPAKDIHHGQKMPYVEPATAEWHPLLQGLWSAQGNLATITAWRIRSTHMQCTTLSECDEKYTNHFWQSKTIIFSGTSVAGALQERKNPPGVVEIASHQM